MRLEPKRRAAAAPDRRPPSLEERIGDEARFFKAWFENPSITGAVSPSGRFLARAMARYVDPRGRGPIVELGPGTGPVTQALLDRGVAPERLVLVEYDEAFCRLLARRFPRCVIVKGDAYDLRRTLAGVLDEPPRAIVSSLPLLNQPDAARLSLLDEALGLMRPDGCFIQFTYGMVSPMPRARAGAAFFEAEASPPVWLNLPPARVWTYRRAGVSARIEAPEALIVKLKRKAERLREELRETRASFEAQSLRAAKTGDLKPAVVRTRRPNEERDRRR